MCSEVMMLFKIHISKPLQQLFPIISSFLFTLLTRVSTPLPVSSFFLQSSSFFRIVSPFHPIISVLFWNLRFVVRFSSRRKIIMHFLFNWLFRRKPPLYSVQSSPWRSPMCRVLLLSSSSVISWRYPVVVAAMMGHSMSVGVGVIPLYVIFILTVSLQPRSTSRVRRMKCGNCHKNRI